MLKAQCTKLKNRLQESQLEGKRVRASVMLLETEVERLKGRLFQSTGTGITQVTRRRRVFNLNNTSERLLPSTVRREKKK